MGTEPAPRLLPPLGSVARPKERVGSLQAHAQWGNWTNSDSVSVASLSDNWTGQRCIGLGRCYVWPVEGFEVPYLDSSLLITWTFKCVCVCAMYVAGPRLCLGHGRCSGVAWTPNA